mmetsp:Transcript_18230/g.24361  ORF Transcript_18230/g.24361 Transcript_18230/m.24361 type:complete len:80 (+) Transcript_18230:452-691(+)
MSPATQRFDVDVAFPCDIDLQWYLVPKTWVRMLVFEIKYTEIQACAEWMLTRQARTNGQVAIQLEANCRKAISLAQSFG